MSWVGIGLGWVGQLSLSYGLGLSFKFSCFKNGSGLDLGKNPSIPISWV
jgi:hypothetical protein